MRRVLTALLALTAVPAQAQEAAPAPPTVRALFVGIDKYQWSAKGDPGPDGFKDLQGAVGDVRRFKASLRKTFGFDLDAEGGEGCETRNAVSITLLDQCAKREAILRALADRINSASPGDTVLLYFAGHGTLEPELGSTTEIKGISTFVPHDARDPERRVREIYDKEFKVFREWAVALGLNFVMVFDSCHSGSIGRDGRIEGVGTARKIPPLKPADLQRLPAPDLGGLAAKYGLRQPDGARPGYQVVLSASEDDELAHEIPVGDVGKAGVFTTGLIDAIQDNPRGTFGDWAEGARLFVTRQKFGDQHPKAEMDIRASLFAGASDVVLHEASGTGGEIRLLSGSLAGITQGSEFAFFTSQAAALRKGAVPLIVGKVSEVEAYSALVAPDRPLRAPVERLYARETAHSWGAESIGIAVRSVAGIPQPVLDQMLGKQEFVTRKEPYEAFLVAASDGKGMELRAADGALVRRFSDPSGATFESDLAETFRHLLRSKLLLGLLSQRTVPNGPGGIANCVAADQVPDADKCGEVDVDTGAHLGPLEKPGIIALGKDTYRVTVRNTAKEARYLYVLGISPDWLQVVAVTPPPGAVNQQLAPNKLVTSDAFYFSKPGTWRFVVLSTQTPINAAALEQKGLAARDPALCATGIDPALCAAGQGRPDPDARAVQDWSARVTEVVVK